MPFSINQMLGGWRRKESKKATTKESQRLSTRRRTTPVETLDAEASLGGVEKNKRISKESSVPARGAVEKGKSEFAAELLISPHVSEKATMMNDPASTRQGAGNYVFKVKKNSSKQTLKQAIEDRYGVEVVSINVLNTPDKKRRRGAIIGSRPGYKKAIISLKAGQVISEF